MRAAAAITSITMNGGTSLRAEGLINRRAASNICSVLSISRDNPPRCRRIFTHNFRHKGPAIRP